VTRVAANRSKRSTKARQDCIREQKDDGGLVAANFSVGEDRPRRAGKGGNGGNSVLVVQRNG